MRLSGFKPFKFIILLSFLLLIISGCGGGHKSGGRKPVRADQLLAESLQTMKNARSYRFTGSGSIQYLDVNDRGTFSITGEYKYPNRSRLKIKLKLGSANYHSETFYRNTLFYQSVNESWKLKPYDPDTLIQPGYKPVSLLLEQIPQGSGSPVYSRDETVDGTVYRVVKISSNPIKLKAYLQKQFNKAIALEPERRQGLQNFLKNCAVSQDYTLYIDPNTKHIVKILFNSSVKVNLPGSKMESRLAAEYSVTGFGSSVTMPAVPGDRK